jgi:hypothetical protein
MIRRRWLAMAVGAGAGICGGECSRTGNNASRQGQSAGVS